LVLGSKEEGLAELIEEISGYLEKGEEPAQSTGLGEEKVLPLPSSSEVVEEAPAMSTSSKEEELRPLTGLEDKLTTLEQKRLIQSERRKATFLNTLAATKSLTSSIEFKFEFADAKQQEKFERFKEGNEKLNEVLEEIKFNKWNTTGIGKPEVLKPFNRYRACFSRRLNGEHRLVYKVKQGKILILA
jgi:Txe/YoeB family toxin of toxin-antitoxin system